MLVHTLFQHLKLIIGQYTLQHGWLNGLNLLNEVRFQIKRQFQHAMILENWIVRLNLVCLDSVTQSKSFECISLGRTHIKIIVLLTVVYDKVQI